MAEMERCPENDFDITREEVDRIGKAMKSEEFRKLLVEYAEEVSDPANVKLYQDEITQLEKERGVDITFINPEPGYVIKTSADGSRKAFINVCKNANVGKPTSQLMTQGSSLGTNWLLPHALAPPRDDTDKNKNRCVVYDVVFHPEAFILGEKNPKFKSLLTETALDAVEKNFNVELDRRNVKFPNIRFKGVYRPAVIRKSSPGSSVREDHLASLIPTAGESRMELEEKNNSPHFSVAGKSPAPPLYTTPKYSVIHRSCLDLQDYTNDKTAKMNATVPTELVVEVHLPLLSSSADVVLDVMEKSLILVSESSAKYKLELQLPYSVDEEKGSAKFDQTARKLVITLPVKLGKKPHVTDVGREDSGVECDHSCQTSESNSSDEIFPESKEYTIVSVDRTSKTSIDSDSGYRTSHNTELFLKSDICYSFPAFTCNTIENMIVFILHVKNVDTASVEYRHIAKSGIHVKFISVGSGFFPLCYAFCAMFPSNCCVEENSVNIETWDNNVIVQLQCESRQCVLTEVFVGVDEESTVKHTLPEPAAIAEKLKNMEVSAGSGTDLTGDERLDINVTRSDEDSIEITVAKHESEIAEDVFESSDEQKCESAEMQCGGNSDQGGKFNDDGRKQDSTSMKIRKYSESSADEMGSSRAKKGILKHNGRVSRSLSESSIDEYTWSSLDMVTQSGSESRIREEDEEEDDEDRGTKKTVRFNDVIRRKTFRMHSRPNSSILGQQKKNQRKQRNKKRAQERRASESENSEGEVDRERMEKLGSEDEDHTGSTSSVNDEGVSEKDEQLLFSLSDSFEENSGSVPKSSRNKGKRRNRKGSSKQRLEAVRKLELKSDLIFDIDV